MNLVEWHGFGFTNNSKVYGVRLGPIPFWQARQVLKTRLFRVDWDTTPIHLDPQPRFKLWVYTRGRQPRRGRTGVYVELGRLHLRYAPIAKADWVKEGRTFWRPLPFR